jgi:hypothetical protein
VRRQLSNFRQMRRLDFARFAHTERSAGQLLLCMLVSAGFASSVGCNEAPHRLNRANAPTLTAGDAPVLRNVADPNAPFLLKPSPPRLAKREPLLDVNGVEPCVPSQLTIFESRARVTGVHHTLRLSLSNQAEACRLGGYPAITLLDEAGRVIGSVVTQRVSEDAMSASLVKGLSAAAPIEQTDVEAPAAQILLAHAGEAAFELGWSTGPSCTAISRIAVGTPGLGSATPAPMLINRPLRLCNGTLLVTAISAETAAQ